MVPICRWQRSSFWVALRPRAVHSSPPTLAPPNPSTIASAEEPYRRHPGTRRSGNRPRGRLPPSASVPPFLGSGGLYTGSQATLAAAMDREANIFIHSPPMRSLGSVMSKSCWGVGRANLNAGVETGALGNRCPGFGRFPLCGGGGGEQVATENCRCLFRRAVICWERAADIKHATGTFITGTERKQHGHRAPSDKGHRDQYAEKGDH